MSAISPLTILLSTFLAIASFVTPSQAESDAELYDELGVFTDAFTLIQKDYVQEVKNKQLVEGAIKGMLSSLDPHSGYLDTDFFKEMQIQTKGEFGGLGIEITMKDGVIIVIAPMEDSPASRAGIQPGDAIVKIDGTFTKDLNLMDAVRKLRGQKGSPVLLSIYRKGMKGLFDVTLKREEILVKSIKSRYLKDGFGYVRINQFMESTFDDLKSALSKLKNSTPDLKGLVIDLRNNPGGLLNQAVKVADLFLNDGVIVYTESRVESQKQRYFAHERGTEPDYPIVLLVNGGSASASEIVAGAMKDHGRGLVIGNQTFGKGSVQTVTPLRNGGALSLTTALYFTKSGRSIQLTGVTPDVEVVPDPVQIAGVPSKPEMTLMREGDLPGAIKNPSGIKSPTQSSEPAPQSYEEVKIEAPLDIERASLDDLLLKDPYLRKGIEVLEGYGVVPEKKAA